mgnify:CR=1 FL=1
MSRQIDRMLVRPACLPRWCDPKERLTLAGLLSELATCEVIIADNVAHYWASGNDQEMWDWTDDFPCLAPPFESFWIECRAPRLMVSEVTGTQILPYLEGWGAYVEARRNPEGGWKLMLALFVEVRKWRSTFMGGMSFDIDEKGVCPKSIDTAGRNHSISYAVPFAPRMVASGVSEMEFKGLVGAWVQPLALAICFMNCKNVELIERVPIPRLSRAHEHRHGRGLVTYHTLEIDPMRRVLRSEGREEEVGLRHALHICRGHFKDYREHGLFGKRHGVYWWDSHVRGEIESGVTLKDYVVAGMDTEPPRA